MKHRPTLLAALLLAALASLNAAEPAKPNILLIFADDIGYENAVDLAPDKVYDSTFVQSKWDSGVVTIRYGKEERILDFNQ